MLNESQREMLQMKAPTWGRIFIGLLFLVSGLGMLLGQGPSGVATFFGSLGLPAAGLMAWVAIITKIVAGGALVIGKKVEMASGILVIFTALTILIAHRHISDPSQLTQALKNLAIIGGLLLVMASSGKTKM